MKYLLLAGAAAVTLTGTVKAQDLGANFDGFSIGVKGGFSGAQSEVVFSPQLSPDFDDGRFSGGAFVGYDMPFEHGVFGLVVDFDYLNLEAEETSFNGKGDQFDYDYDVDWAATARLRAGGMFSDNTLFYATGGGAISQISFSEEVVSAGQPFSSQSSSDKSEAVLIGGVVGIGFEYAAANGFFARSELLHYQFGSIEAGDSKIRPQINTINVGIGYRF